jgi:hypothetical protein
MLRAQIDEPLVERLLVDLLIDLLVVVDARGKNSEAAPDTLIAYGRPFMTVVALVHTVCDYREREARG